MRTSLANVQFRGKRAIVTGGAHGLGRSIAEALAAAYAEVHVFDAATAEFPSGGGVHAHVVDVASAAAVAAAVQALPGPPALLVNYTGLTHDRWLARMADPEWDEVIAVTLTGAFHLIRACAPLMAREGYGRIVNIASIDGLRGRAGHGNFAAAKSGLIGLTRSAAREFGRKGVTVNAIAPGMVLTNEVAALPEALRANAMAEAALAHLATSDDVAAAVLFLLSDAARAITGAVLTVDAGQSI